MAGRDRGQPGLPGASVPRQEAGMAVPLSSGVAISILGQRLVFLMKTHCLSAAGTEGLLLTLVPVAAQLISNGHKRIEPQLSQGARQHIPTASLLPPASARVANSLLLPGSGGDRITPRAAKRRTRSQASNAIKAAYLVRILSLLQARIKSKAIACLLRLRLIFQHECIKKDGV